MMITGKKKKSIGRSPGIFLAVFFMLWMVLPVHESWAATGYPKSRGAVNDFAGVIDAENTAKMEALAQEVLQKTGTAVVVATVETIGENEDYNMYVNGLYQAWGIGKKGEDKGVLIFLTVKERKIRIETGYGVEGILPDGRVGEILDTYVVPFLKDGHYGKGLYNAMYACSAYIAREAGVQLSGSPMPYRANAQLTQRKITVFEILFFLIAAAVLLGTRRGREMLPWLLVVLMSGGRGGGGGGFGGGFGGFGGGMSGGGGAGRSF
ncbi:MAG TPA: TPM domain-containing protein [Smithellaceae bacterium]|nr:TPM domain-containing protein [Smithella sp.]HPL97681.1 TPM domain-containing protein [Smithellaceae bacterium]